MPHATLRASLLRPRHSPDRSHRARTLCAGFAIAAVGCGSIGARPYLTPLPDAVVDTVPAAADVVIGQIQTLVIGEGLAVRVSSPAEGFLETQWYDVDRRGPVGGSLDPRRIVRLRFFADMLGTDRTLLTSEAVTLRAIDPSLPERQNEVMVPPGHPGSQIVERILIALRSGMAAGSR